MKALRDNGLTLFFLALTLATLVAQAFAGLAVERSELASHGARDMPGLLEYVTSSTYGAHVLENWQSEFLQFFMFIAATIWLVQRGSSESKPVDEAGTEGDEHATNWFRANGLLLVMFACFVATWSGQSISGWREFNDTQAMHGDPEVTWATFVTTADFWEPTLQNWQSEFLAVAAMSIFTVYLRQAGSPESKRLEALDSRNEPTY